jgi:glycosyltransferase involved in cell wall biosynthesis
MGLAQSRFVDTPYLESRIITKGKFFDRRGRKFFFKAMRLETEAKELDFNQKVALRYRFDELARNHTTGLVLKQAQAESIIAVAAQAGLQVLVEISFDPAQILSRSGLRDVITRSMALVADLRGYANLLGYLIDCPILPDQLRQVGFARFRRRIQKVIGALRYEDESRVVALKHNPAIIGLTSEDENLIYAVPPPLSLPELRAFVARLHNIAESRPVVLEFAEGLCGQDELVACAFGLGAAGVVAPVMRPAARSGGLDIRTLNSQELLPFVTLNGSCPPNLADSPMVSVVICAYNAERTTRPCLESLRKINYPNYEVVIVDDGSRDATAEIAAEFPEFRLIRQPNKGLSVARNVGMQAANGEIIAYTDSDCVVDPDWLSLMVRNMKEGGFDGCGGPNYAPHEDGRTEACVAASPGAPCHVLVGDVQAEHLAGCNMVFHKAALEKIGGFDPQFTAAGDDVDICWRLLDAGFTLGFCPSAFVWHFRRNTVKAYYGQQRGYGNAEAMLYIKYPERFNSLGQIRWQGTIPGLARTIPGGNRLRVRWTRGNKIQEISAPSLSIMRVLPLTTEWNAAILVALALSLGFGVTLLPALALLLLGPAWAAYYAARAPLERSHRGFRARLLIAWLAYSGPISRTVARYRTRRRLRRPAICYDAPRQRPTLCWMRRSLRLSYWNDAWITREKLLDSLTALFGRAGTAATPDHGWRDADLRLEPGALSQIEIKTADEEHSGNRIKSLVEIRARLTPITRMILGLSASSIVIAVTAGYAAIAAASAFLAGAIMICAASEMFGKMQLVYRSIEQSAHDLGLSPLGAPVLVKRRVASRVEQQNLNRIAG